LAARFPGSAATGSSGADDAVPASFGDGLAPAFWTAFRRSANAMVLVDLDRRIVAANQAAADLVGRPVQALVGAALLTVLDDPSEALDDATWRARIVAGESFGRRRIRRADGSTVQIDFAMRAASVDERPLVLGVCLDEREERQANDLHAPARLTAREREIVGLIALGGVTADICRELHVAPDTVRTHVRHAMAKTGARTRAQLIAIALSEGLLDR
jgi:PAS domain S-box-containing protein